MKYYYYTRIKSDYCVSQYGDDLSNFKEEDYINGILTECIKFDLFDIKVDRIVVENIRYYVVRKFIDLDNNRTIYILNEG